MVWQQAAANLFYYLVLCIFFSCVWLVHYLSTHSCHPSPAGAIVAASTLPNPSPRTAAGRRDPSIAMTMVHVDPSYNAQSTFSEIDPAQTTPQFSSETKITHSEFDLQPKHNAT
jgi:hypothetical protein